MCVIAQNIFTFEYALWIFKNILACVNMQTCVNVYTWLQVIMRTITINRGRGLACPRWQQPDNKDINQWRSGRHHMNAAAHQRTFSHRHFYPLITTGENNATVSLTTHSTTSGPSDRNGKPCLTEQVSCQQVRGGEEGEGEGEGGVGAGGRGVVGVRRQKSDNSQYSTSRIRRQLEEMHSIMAQHL